jgi:uncharacterized damage-inducible protein DinB
MSNRSEALVADFWTSHHELVQTIEGLSDEQWAQIPANELRTVAAVAYHVAAGYPLTMVFAQIMLRGEPFPTIEPAAMHALNAEEGAKHARATKAEVLALLQTNAEAVAQYVAALTDEQLDTVGAFFNMTLPVHAAVTGLVIGHLKEHLATIKSVVAEPALAD